MDTAQVVEATCPYCGESYDFRTWPTLDPTLDAHAAHLLEHGSLYEAACPKCGRSYSYVYPTFYHDPSLQVAVWFDPETALVGAPAPSDAEVVRMLVSWVADPTDPTGASTMFYTLRRVWTHYELAEKVLAFGMGIDDRVLELAKVRALQLKYGDDLRAVRAGRLFLDDVEADGTIRLLGLLAVPASEPGSLWGPGAPEFVREERVHLVKVAPDVLDELRLRLDPVDQNPPDCVVDRAWAMRELGLPV